PRHLPPFPTRRSSDLKPVRARPIAMPEKALKWVRRNSWAALLLALLSMSLLGGVAGVSWKWLEANANARQAIEEKSEAQPRNYRSEEHTAELQSLTQI